MLSTVTVPAGQSSAALNQPLNMAAVAPVPAQAVNNLTYHAVPANSSPVALFNNVKGNSSEQSQASSIDIVIQDSDGKEGQSSAPARKMQTPRYGDNSIFLAQSIAQEQLTDGDAIKSLQKNGANAYQKTISRNAVNLNQQAVLNVSKAA